MCFLNINPTKKSSALVWALTDSDLPAPLPSPDARVPVVSPAKLWYYNTVTSLSKAGRLGYWEPYYGTWDPLLQCLLLSKPLLQQQNTKKPHGTKNNCMPVQLGQILDKRHKKTKTPYFHFWRTKSKTWMLGAKARYCACPLHTASPKGCRKHLSHPSGQTPEHTHTLNPLRNKLTAPSGSSKQGKLFSLPAAAAGTPVKPCLNFLSGL